MSEASAKVQVAGSTIDGLLAAIAAMERAQEDLDRAVVITGIGSLLADDIRMCLVRMRIEAQRVKVGTNNGRKADHSKAQATAPVSVYVTVRYYGGAYLARTSPPAATGKASSTSDAKSAAIAAARKAVPKGQLTGAFEETGGLWRVEFSVTS